MTKIEEILKSAETAGEEFKGSFRGVQIDMQQGIAVKEIALQLILIRGELAAIRQAIINNG